MEGPFRHEVNASRHRPTQPHQYIASDKLMPESSILLASRKKEPGKQPCSIAKNTKFPLLFLQKLQILIKQAA